MSRTPRWRKWPGTAIVADVLRLCLDPHILVSHVRSTRRGRRRPLGHSSVWKSAARELVGIVQFGGSEVAAVQLVLSLDQLDEFSDALRKAHFPEPVVRDISEDYMELASIGPLHENPHLILGGTGVLPAPGKPRRSLEIALAGRAHVLATEAITQYITDDAVVLENGEVLIHDAPDWSLVIATPQRVAGWIRDEVFPDAVTIRNLILNGSVPTPR